MIEKAIIRHLVFNDKFSRKVLPHLKENYFENISDKIIFKLIKEFSTTYGKTPTTSSLLIDVKNISGYNDDVTQQAITEITNLKPSDEDYDWLIDSTEDFCKSKAIYNGIMDSISIIQGENKKLTSGAIPQLLSDALSVSFDSSVGHDFLEDFNQRFDFYHKAENKIPFDIEYLNTITGGGLPSKSLNLFLGGSGTGKTLVMCHMAASNLNIGKNVLYITLEMAEERIAERIDANLLNLRISDIPEISEKIYKDKIKKLKEKVKGRLIIKEYPTATAGALTFENLLSELKIKKNFKPDIIYIDYISICKSERTYGNSANSYTLVKSIAEELRGLAMKFNLPLVSGVQLNRCLSLDTSILMSDGKNKLIKNIKVGDSLKGSSGDVSVLKIYPKIRQKVFLITTKSGKKVKCSNKHIFPTSRGLKSMAGGLQKGDKLFSKL